MRRILVLCLCVFLLQPSFVFGLEMETLPKSAESLSAALLMERDSGTVLMEKNSVEALPAAGLVRLPALLMVCEAIDRGELSLQQKIRISREAASIGGSTAFLEEDEMLLAGDLLKAAVMILAGDALYALAENLFGSEKNCLEKLQQRLAELSVSVSYAGLLDSEAHLSARDLAGIARALSESTSYRSCSMLYTESLLHESGRKTDLTSANRLLKSCTGCIGGLTGSSKEAKYGGVFFVQRGGVCYISVVLGAENASMRTEAAKSMTEQAFSTYTVKHPVKEGDLMLRDLPVKQGLKPRTDLIAAADISLLLRGGSYSVEEEIPEALEAPLERGKVYGKIRYLDETGTVLAELPLTVKESIPVAKLADRMKAVLFQWVFA